MKVFVSYTRRDGLVTQELLENLSEALEKYSEPFIHTIKERKIKIDQSWVMQELKKAELVIFIKSPASYHSPWVLIELLFARLRLIPIVVLPVGQIQKWPPLACSRTGGAETIIEKLSGAPMSLRRL